MGYTSPATQGADIVPVARFASYKAGLDYLATDKPHVRGRRTTAQSIPNNTRTAITLDAERFDQGGVHSTSSNTSRLTVPTGEAGKYLSGAHGEFAAVNTTGVRQFELFVNATTLIAVQQAPAANAIQDLTVVSFYNLAAADYIEMTAVQTSGGALNANANSAWTTEAWMIWMST